MSVIKPALQHPELIAYFSGANNYCWLYFRNGEKKLLAKPISFLERKLPGFIRVHKTILVNPACVESLHRPPRQKMAGEIRLNSGEIFPVSRRRWQEVAESLPDRLMSVSLDETAIDKTVLIPPAQVTRQAEPDGRSIFLITEDDQNALLTKHIIGSKWPAYQVHTAKQSSHLPELLRHLPSQKYPILLLLDARTSMLERLHTLQRLKENAQLCGIPVILFVAPIDQSIIEGYKHQANSVISIPDRYTPLAQIVERVCQFWLRTVALPGMGQ